MKINFFISYLANLVLINGSGPSICSSIELREALGDLLAAALLFANTEYQTIGACACAGAGAGAGWPSSGFLSFDTPPVSDVRICSRLTAMPIKRAGNRLQQMHRSHDPQWPRYRFVTSI